MVSFAKKLCAYLTKINMFFEEYVNCIELCVFDIITYIYIII